MAQERYFKLRSIGVDEDTWGKAIELAKSYSRSISSCIREIIKSAYEKKEGGE